MRADQRRHGRRRGYGDCNAGTANDAAYEHQERHAMTSPESENEIEEVISTPATPGAQALPSEADDEDDATTPE